MEEVADAAEDYEGWDREQREEYGVVGTMDTGIARACRGTVVEAYVDFFFPFASSLSRLCIL